jgi:protein ImuB
MLWLCLHPTRLSLEALDAADRPDIAIVQRKGNRRWIVDSTASCASGMELGAALSLYALTQIERRPEAERAALEQLAYFAYSLGAPVHIATEEPRWFGDAPMGAVFVEVSASLSLFGGLDALRRHVSERIGEQVLTVKAGLAPTIEGSLLAAQAGLVFESLPRLKSWLKCQPLVVLRLPEKALSVCQGSGMRTAADVLRLPAESLARRFGPEVPRYLRRLLGKAADPRQAIVPPETFERRWQMHGVIETVEGLLFPLRRLFVELEHYLRARDSGLMRFHIDLVHEDHSRSVVDVGLSMASRDAAHFLLITRQRFERVELPGGVVELALRADAFDAPNVAQHDLFDNAAKRLQEWNALVEKLRARWGPDALWSVTSASDQRPEKAWRKLDPGDADVPVECPPRPAWLLPQPQLIERPTELLGTAERIAIGWWEETAERDYFRARAPDGRGLWVYRDKDTQRWHLHGFWS